MSNTVSHEKYCLISNIKKVSKIRKSLSFDNSQLKFNLESKKRNEYYSPLVTNNPALLLVTNVIKKV